MSALYTWATQLDFHLLNLYNRDKHLHLSFRVYRLELATYASCSDGLFLVFCLAEDKDNIDISQSAQAFFLTLAL